jgi:hypothetical protein
VNPPREYRSYGKADLLMQLCSDNVYSIATTKIKQYFQEINYLIHFSTIIFFRQDLSQTAWKESSLESILTI